MSDPATDKNLFDAVETYIMTHEPSAVYVGYHEWFALKNEADRRVVGRLPAENLRRQPMSLRGVRIFRVDELNHLGYGHNHS